MIRHEIENFRRRGRRVSNSEKADQCAEYSKYLRSAWECCGVTSTQSAVMLKESISLGQKGRRSAQNKLPYCLRRALGLGQVLW